MSPARGADGGPADGGRRSGPAGGSDPALAAARYRARAGSGAGSGTDVGTGADEGAGAGTGTSAGGRGGAGASAGPDGHQGDRLPTAGELRTIARLRLDQAIERGDFDDLPGAGEPLPGLTGGTLDPDWWIKGLIEREQLSGLAPPALSLRTEHARLDDALDALGTERAVREALADFNSRVVEARRQLSGGPPVVTPTRDVDDEVRRWHGRRAERRRAAEAALPPPRPSWRERRRAAREARGAARAARRAARAERRAG